MYCCIALYYKYNIIGSFFTYTPLTSKEQLERAMYDENLNDYSSIDPLQRKSTGNDKYHRYGLQKNTKIGNKMSPTKMQLNLRINQPKSRKQRRYI